MAGYRWVECEGGPRDGCRVPMAEECTELHMTLARPVVDCSKPPAEALAPLFRTGIYRRDPLDYHTVIWVGER